MDLAHFRQERERLVTLVNLILDRHRGLTRLRETAKYIDWVAREMEGVDPDCVHAASEYERSINQLLGALVALKLILSQLELRKEEIDAPVLAKLRQSRERLYRLVTLTAAPSRSYLSSITIAALKAD